MKKLLWVGDEPNCPSGFGRVTREVLETVQNHYDTTVLGINYRGDPRPKGQYDVWAAAVGGDGNGVKRLIWMCDRIKPDIIVFQNDGWNIPGYIQQLSRFPQYTNIPTVASLAVDGKNFIGPWLTGVSMAVFWTQFGFDEARAGGYGGPATVIPLGVDTSIYKPKDRQASRLKQMRGYLSDGFLVGSVNRNQPRKRWDLLIKYFSEWVHTKNISDAYLYLHTSPTGDDGVEVEQLLRYYGIFNHTIQAVPAVWYGITEDEICDAYNCFDVFATTTQGEGFGLTALEAMACGIPCILPDWSAYGDWASRGAWLVPCTTTAIGPPYVNVVGGIADEKKFITALHALYSNTEAREQNAKAAYECAMQPQFNWQTIGQRWVELLDSVLEEAKMEGELRLPTEVK